MGPDNRQKVCPVCRTVQPIQATVCQCGHQFRTQFAPTDQTQVISPQGFVMPQSTQMPYQLVTGPRDLTEWRFGVALAWFFATIATLLVYFALNAYPFKSPAGILTLILYGAAMASQCLKLRRYYVYPPVGVYPRFWATFIPLVVVVGLLMATDTARRDRAAEEDLLPLLDQRF